MRKLTLFLSLILMISFSANSFADTYSTTITAKTWSAYDTQTLSSVAWTAAATGGAFWGYDATKGQQFGSSNSPATALNLTTSGISGVITDIKVTTSGASSIVGTVGVSVGGKAFSTGGASTATLTSTSTAFDFTGSGSGAIVISWSQSSSKALYLKTIEVTYTTCNASNLAFATTSISKMIGDAKFTQTATSLNTDAIAYSSSATNVATVNATTGEVTVVGIGSTTITASQAATNGYCANTATYALTVTALPTLTLTDVTNPAMTSTVGTPVSQILNISGLNLTTDLGLSITGVNADQFTLSQYGLSPVSGNVPNTAITITYTPTSVGNHTATLTMASTNALSVSRTLTGTSSLQGLNTVTEQLNVTALNGKIYFQATAGETLNVFNAVGQKLVQKSTLDGENIVSISATGVVVVKVGNRIAKVIL